MAKDSRTGEASAADRTLTEPLDAENVLLSAEGRLQLATEAAGIGWWDVESGHGRLFWPARVKAMFGISADAPVTMEDFYAGLHPDDRDAGAVTAAIGSALFRSPGISRGTKTMGGDPTLPQFGVVFELTPSGATWRETVLHTFSGRDGSLPGSGVILGGAGNLFGSTGSGTGAPNSPGTVFELAHSAAGWKLKTLTTFQGGADRAELFGAPVLYRGSLFGTAFRRVGTIPSGTVYQLTPRSGGSWSRSVIFAFDQRHRQRLRAGRQTAGAQGGLFGTTVKGAGRCCAGNGCGVVYKITP